MNLYTQILCTIWYAMAIAKDVETDPAGRNGRLLSYITVEQQQTVETNNLRGSIDLILLKLDSLKKNTVTKQQLNNINAIVDKGLQVCPWNVRAVEIGGSCYSLFAEQKSFYSARKTCQAFGGDLAVLNLQDNLLHKLRPYYPAISIDGKHHETWIGAFRRNEYEPFKFLDGTVIEPTNSRWNKNTHEHDCVILDDVDLPKHMIIDDCRCTDQKSFLCQFEPLKII